MKATLKRRKGITKRGTGTGWKGAWGNPRAKYGAKKYVSPILKREFDSIGEGKYGEHLWAKQQNGEIKDLAFQVRWDCKVNGVRIGKRYMKLDYSYYDLTREEQIWSDFKGMMTPEWALKRDLWAAGGPGVLIIVRAKRSKVLPYTFEEIRPITYCQKQETSDG